MKVASELALRSRGTPRTNRLASVCAILLVGMELSMILLQMEAMLDVDHEGLDYVDQKSAGP